MNRKSTLALVGCLLIALSNQSSAKRLEGDEAPMDRSRRDTSLSCGGNGGGLRFIADLVGPMACPALDGFLALFKGIPFLGDLVEDIIGGFGNLVFGCSCTTANGATTSPPNVASTGLNSVLSAVAQAIASGAGTGGVNNNTVAEVSNSAGAGVGNNFVNNQQGPSSAGSSSDLGPLFNVLSRLFTGGVNGNAVGTVKDSAGGGIGNNMAGNKDTAGK